MSLQTVRGNAQLMRATAKRQREEAAAVRDECGEAFFRMQLLRDQLQRSRTRRRQRQSD
jgi:hypothetical protein